MQIRLLDLLRGVDAKLAAFFALPLVAFNGLLLVVLLAHGYEIFNLHLTIDEEVHAGHVGITMAWINQGRWGMGILSTIIPTSVVPTVSTALGVGLLATALWLLVVQVFRHSRYTGFCAVSLAITLPTLPFTMSFATLAYGIGFASLASVVFIVLLRSDRVSAQVSAALAGAFAISVYQPMIFALAAVLAVELCRTDAECSNKTRLRGIAVLAGAVVAYFGIDMIVRKLLAGDVQYVDQFVDIKGLLVDPLGRLSTATRNTEAVLRVSRRLFALRTPWVGFFFIAAMLVAIKPAFQNRGIARHTPLIAVALLIALPILAEAVSAHGVPLRSGVYFPFVVCFVAATAFRNSGVLSRSGLATLALLATLGNSVVVNRLYAAAGFGYERDRSLAQDILREVAKLTATDSPTRQLPIEVVGIKTWPESMLIPKRETLGASFFEWDSGNRFRAAMFLNEHGLSVVGATDEQRLPIIPIALQMPAWPVEGWVRREHDIIVVKLGDYTAFQRQALCAAGFKDLCG